MTNILYDALFSPHAGQDMPFLIRDDGIVLSFDDVIKRAAQLAHVLTGVGVSPGDRIVVQAGKFSDTIALYAASVQTGAVYLPLNTAYTKAELRYFIADAGPRLVICDPKDAATLTPVAEEVGAVLMTLGGDGGSLQQAANKQPTAFDTVARGPDDLAALLYTSGTTGRSKGAMMSHRNLLSNAQELVQLWRITDQDRLIHALPIFHTHGLFVAMNTSLLAGAQVRLMSGFDLDVLIEEMPRSTLLMGVPTFYTRLLGDARFDRQRAANMRLFISGSAPLLAETHQAFEARSGHRILERYGMTETNMITSNPYDGDRVAGTVGFAVPGTEVKITDPETGTALPAGSIGMIETRGPNVFQGYWNMPEKTAEELCEDGFFITGDLAVMASDGRVSIVGRAKDLIISGGYNIYPKEIEDVLNADPTVLESAVFGVPHPDSGESVFAAIVAEPGQTVDDQALQTHAAAHLAKFKLPRRFVVMDALPLNTMGKVQKNVLRGRFST